MSDNNRSLYRARIELTSLHAIWYGKGQNEPGFVRQFIGDSIFNYREFLLEKKYYRLEIASDFLLEKFRLKIFHNHKFFVLEY